MRGRHGSNDFLKGPLPQNMEGRHGCVCDGDSPPPIFNLVNLVFQESPVY